MSKVVEKNELQDVPHYPISMVSGLLDLNAMTLLAWERPYDLIEPDRKSFGHRLYTQARIDFITRVIVLETGLKTGLSPFHDDVTVSQKGVGEDAGKIAINGR